MPTQLKNQFRKFNQEPLQIIESSNKIYSFTTQIENGNIDKSVVDSFGEEWSKFHQFSDEEIDKIGKMYFDIIDEKMVNKNTYGIDIGCGTGRWTKYLLDKIGFMEAIDPSTAILMADKLLAGKNNVRLSQASTDNIPFEDETFDFGMSIGVLHHIPNTQKAMADCVRKIKIGGYFYTYLYYNISHRSIGFRALFSIVNLLRKFTSSLPSIPKKIACDIIAIFFYMPFILLGRFFKYVGFKNLANKIPLNFYQDKSYFVIRNDSLDRFGTSLEQRFTKNEVELMMKQSGLDEIVIADTLPYWHAVGRRVN